MSNLTNNTTKLQNLLTKINELPEDGTANIGANKLIQVTTTSRATTLSITNLSETDYDYLLDCNAIMLFCYTKDSLSDDEIYAGVYSIATNIGNSVTDNSKLNRTFTTYMDYMVIGYSDVQDVIVTKDNNGINLSISTDGIYFAGNATYYIIGFKV